MSFAAETTITVPSGGVQIAELRAGDLVLGTGEDRQWASFRVKSAEARTVDAELLQLTFANGKSLAVTLGQPLFSQNKGLVPAGILAVGDHIWGPWSQPIRITAVSLVPYKGTLCDVATSAGPGLDGHLIEANGFVAGDADLGGGG